MRASNFTLQVIIYGKIQFLEYDGGLEVVNNSADIHKQREATVETSIWGRDSSEGVNGRRSRSISVRNTQIVDRPWGGVRAAHLSSNLVCLLGQGKNYRIW